MKIRLLIVGSNLIYKIAKGLSQLNEDNRSRKFVIQNISLAV